PLPDRASPDLPGRDPVLRVDAEELRARMRVVPASPADVGADPGELRVRLELRPERAGGDVLAIGGEGADLKSAGGELPDVAERAGPPALPPAAHGRCSRRPGMARRAITRHNHSSSRRCGRL